MFRFISLLALAVSVCGLLATSVSADRLILIPKGDTLTTGGLKGEAAIRATDGDGQAYWANIGISRLEVEGALFQNFGRDNSTAVSAQLSILPETSFTPAVAFGVRDIGDQADQATGLYDGRTFYLAASKGVPFSTGIPILQDVKIHGGVGTGSLSGVFFGAEAGVGPLHIAGEYDTDKFNFAATYSILPLVKVKISSMKSDVYYGAVMSTSF